MEWISFFGIVLIVLACLAASLSGRVLAKGVGTRFAVGGISLGLALILGRAATVTMTAAVAKAASKDLDAFLLWGALEGLACGTGMVFLVLGAVRFAGGEKAEKAKARRGAERWDRPSGSP